MVQIRTKAIKINKVCVSCPDLATSRILFVYVRFILLTLSYSIYFRHLSLLLLRDLNLYGTKIS